MKCVFAHDHWFLRTDAGFHDKGGFPEYVLQKYASAFGELEFVCRQKKVEKTPLALICDPRIRFSPVDNVRSLKGLLSLPRIAGEISRIVSEADLVVARLPSSIGLLAARAARRHDVPCLIEVVGHALEANILHGSLLGRLAGPVEQALMQQAVREAGHVVYITQSYLQGVYPTNGRAFVCPNAAVRPIAPEAARQIRPGGPFVIGLVGSLDVSYKGHDTAIRVLARLVHEHGLKNVSLAFLGYGNPDRWMAQAQALGVAQNMVFAGGVPSGQAVLEWMDGVDMLLQPSLTEGQGRSIIEAMSRARPVVGSNVGGIPELLETDVVFAPDDVNAMAQACHKILTDPDYAAAQMQRNLDFSKSFDADAVEARRQSIFKDMRQAVRAKPPQC